MDIKSHPNKVFSLFFGRFDCWGRFHEQKSDFLTKLTLTLAKKMFRSHLNMALCLFIYI